MPCSVHPALWMAHLFILLSWADLASISLVSSHSEVRASSLVVSMEIENGFSFHLALPPVMSPFTKQPREQKWGISALTHHLQKREVTHSNIVKVDLHVDPEEVACVVLIVTL